MKKFSYRNSLLEALKKLDGGFQWIIPEAQLKDVEQLRKETPVKENLVFERSFTNEKASVIVDFGMEQIEKLNLDNCFSEMKTYLLTVLTELVRNGIIQNFKELDFRDVNLQVYESDEEVYIVVEDGYGTLTSDKIAERLFVVSKHGTYERKVYGAGLGLFMAINNVDLIRFEVTPEKKTYVLAKMKKYKRQKHFKEKCPAIIFEEKER